MKTLIYIIRHGESVGNRDGRFLGHTDGALTERGIRQAETAGAYLRWAGIRPDAVYASDLSRAYVTATLARGGTVIPERGLREIHAGAWEGECVSDIQSKYAEDFLVWLSRIGTSRPTGGESVEELSRRVLSTLFRLARENEGRTLLLGTHATPLRMIETYARGLAVKDAHLVPWSHNAAMSAYLLDGERVTPLFYSFDAYLGSEATSVVRF